MQIVSRVTDLRRVIAEVRASSSAPVTFVPTMGNLHHGHMALINSARSAGGFTVVSIFVNPLQFAPGEDYEQYPRTLEADRELLSEAGVDLLFAPSVAEMHPYEGAGTRVRVEGLSEVLCGACRAGHFDGVTTVVSKLFNQVAPDLAFFGEKDYQQLVVIRRMVADLHMPVSVQGVPTAREADGLATSSRNQYLDARVRKAAPELYATLCVIADRVAAGEQNFPRLLEEGEARLAAAGFQMDYLELRDANLQTPSPGGESADLRVLAAGWLGQARLIDNVPVARDFAQ